MVFPKTVISMLLTNASSKNKTYNSHKEHCKVFVGGLNHTTDEDMLREYFEPFGRVIECTVMRDVQTKISRCFGFVTFSDSSVIEKITRQVHILDSKQVFFNMMI